jgi:hypothetical protein
MIVTFAQRVPPGSETLDRLSQAFSSAMARNGGPVVALIGALLTLGTLAGLVWWALRETRQEHRERSARRARYEAAMSAASTARQRREWVRVAGRLPMTMWQSQNGKRARLEDCETHNVSGGGVAFFSQRPPPLGAPLDFTLDLGEETPLALQGIVARVEPPNSTRLALVALKIEACPAGVRERIARWVAQAKERELVKMRRGRLCRACRRPLTDEAREEHVTCAFEPRSSSSP